MKFPATSDELKAANYEYDREGVCRGCQEPIEWWITPRGAKMPMTIKSMATIRKTGSDVREPHFVTCPNAEDFRK